VAMHVEFCCNDPRNGAALGYFETAEMFGCTLVGGRVTLGWRCEKVAGSNAAEGDESLRVGRLVLPCLGYTAWFGNWCWDRASIRLIHAVDVWNYLAAKKDWHCEEGPDELYEMFNAHQPMDKRTAPELLTRLEAVA
jgi:hypothetical protein